MIAALQMYAWPEVRPATEAFWAEAAEVFRGDGIEAPDALSWPEDLSAAWRAPDLLIGQTCGLPFVHGRCADAVIVARPDYGLEGARGGVYRSALIARRGSPRDLAAFRGGRAAVNELISQSGCNALAGTLVRENLAGPAEPAFFADVVLSGAHRRSAEMVADAEADLAAIDAVAWALFQRLDPARAARIQVVCWSDAAPALPFITGHANARRAGDLARVLDQTAKAMWAASEDPPPPGIPRAVALSSKDDFAPVADLARSLAGLKLAPNVPQLPDFA